MDRKKIFIGLGVLVGIILLILINKNQDSNSSFENKLNNLGFKAEEGSSLYMKQISDIDVNTYLGKVDNKENALYEALYFNMNDKQLIKNEMVYEDGMNVTFIPTYDYSKMKLTYTYRVVYGNSNIMFEGSYNMKNGKYICDNIYTYNFNITESNDDICKKIKYDVEDFRKEVLELNLNI